MKRKKGYEFNQKILSLAQLLLIIVSVLIFCILLFIQSEQQIEFIELMQTNLTFNIAYVISLFEAICFFELYFFNKKLKQNEYFESCILNILLVCIAQFFLLDLFVGFVLAFFIYQTMKMNNLNFKKIYVKAKDNHDLKVIVMNLILLAFSILIIYAMIWHRFA